MSFDLRQNLLMVRVADANVEPAYYFYNACGREYVLSGAIVQEIIERQLDNRFYVPTCWGFASKTTHESWSFSENNDLVLSLSVGPSCHTYLPYEMIGSVQEGFKPINGLIIDERTRHLIRIHLKATAREIPKMIWFNDLPELEKRSVLLSFGLGPLRIEKASADELDELHRRWLEDLDDKFKYTHNAIGLDPEEKIPADYRPERIRGIMDSMMHNTKTLNMMDNTLNDLLRQCRIRGDIPMPSRNFNRHQLTCYYATHLIFAHDADEKLRSLIDNPQFVVNFIYGWYPDYSWIAVNEETFEYQQSLVRAALISIKIHVQKENSTYKLVHGTVKFADGFDPHTGTQVEEEEVSEEETDDVEKEEEQVPAPAARKFPVVLRHHRYDYGYIHRALVEMGVVKKNKTRKQMDKSQKLTVAQQEAALLSTLKAVVLDPEQDLLSKLDETTLFQLAACMTKLKEGDRYPRDAAYLKELIKHAVK